MCQCRQQVNPIVVEVDDEEYFSTLSDNTVLMVLFKDDIWSPQGPAYTSVTSHFV